LTASEVLRISRSDIVFRDDLPNSSLLSGRSSKQYHHHLNLRREEEQEEAQALQAQQQSIPSLEDVRRQQLLQQPPLHRSNSHNNMNDYLFPDKDRPEPTFDETTARNITVASGKTVYLPCKVRHLGDRTVSNRRTFASLRVFDTWMKSRFIFILCFVWNVTWITLLHGMFFECLLMSSLLRCSFLVFVDGIFLLELLPFMKHHTNTKQTTGSRYFLINRCACLTFFLLEKRKVCLSLEAGQTFYCWYTRWDDGKQDEVLSFGTSCSRVKVNWISSKREAIFLRWVKMRAHG
jgi:hypothetical protein